MAERLADLHGVSPECITLGNGSNDVLDLVARVFLTPDHAAVFSQYAFAVYPIVVQATGAQAQVAAAHDGSRGSAYGHDLAAMNELIAPNTRLVFIANPNNPTGTWLNSDELQAFIEGLPGHVLVVVDEAYFEYVDNPQYPDTSKWLQRYPNLIVTRTFSKAYGLAGLRIGYAVAHPELINLLNKVRQPFNVNAMAQSAAMAALDDVTHIVETREMVFQGLEFFARELPKLGIEVVPSGANFILIKTGNGREVFLEMQKRKVIVRPMDPYGLPEFIRITIGTPEQNQTMLNALKEVVG